MPSLVGILDAPPVHTSSDAPPLFGTPNIRAMPRLTPA